MIVRIKTAQLRKDKQRLPELNKIRKKNMAQNYL